MLITRLLVIATAVSLAASHALPIWEMLPRQEKMGQIMYFFAHLVDQSCAYSYIPDCHHLYMLRGLSTLVNMGEHTLNKLDPQQREAQRVIWGAVMGETWLPPSHVPPHLPYYLVSQVDEMSNEIDPAFPNPPQPSPQESPEPLHPYAALPSTLNTPGKAVSNPHPHAVKVLPPPGFEQKTEVDSEDSEDRFASWSDSDAMVGREEEMVREMEAWSGNGDVIVGNQELMGDIYASWSDAEVIVSDQRVPEDRFANWNDAGMTGSAQDIPEDRFAGWNDAGMTVGTQDIPEDRFANWNDAGMTEETQGIPEDRFAGWNDAGIDTQDITEDRFASWNDPGMTGSTQDIPEDRFANWNDAGMTEETQGIPEDRFAGWNEAGLTEEHEKASWNDATVSDSFQETPVDPYASWSESRVPEEAPMNWKDTQTSTQRTKTDIVTDNWENGQDKHTRTESDRQTDRYASWSDSEARMDGENGKEHVKPAGIEPSASFEPLMVESQVVVSRVAPPAPLRAVYSTKRKRSAPDSLLLPLPLLRQ